MKLIGFFLFCLLFVIALGTSDTPGESLRSGGTLENKYFSSSSILFHYTGLPVIYAEVRGRGRRQQPYRNPLRRLCKQLRLEKKKNCRALKEDGLEVSQPSPLWYSTVSEKATLGLKRRQWKSFPCAISLAGSLLSQRTMFFVQLRAAVGIM